MAVMNIQNPNKRSTNSEGKMKLMRIVDYIYSDQKRN